MLNVVRIFFFQAEDGIRYLVRSRGLGDVYKRQVFELGEAAEERQRKLADRSVALFGDMNVSDPLAPVSYTHLTLPTSDLV